MIACDTLLVDDSGERLTITLNRPASQNAFNLQMLEELDRVLDHAERSPGCRMIVIQGQAGAFCRGLDLDEAVARDVRAEVGGASAGRFAALLHRLTVAPQLVVTHVDGVALAGGLGLVAASDWAIASTKARFSLPEAMWGLVPACVGLYLTRRMRAQKALTLSLAVEGFDAAQALTHGLIDEISDAPADALRRLGVRAGRVTAATTTRIKQFYRELWLVDPDREREAVALTDRLMNDPDVRRTIERFVRDGRFPWTSAT